MINFLVILGVMGALCSSPYDADAQVTNESPPLLRQDFESEIPGRRPTGWRPTWGDMGDDTLTVSVLRAQAGKKSLLLDRTIGTHAPMYGVGVDLPDVTGDWAMLTFSLYVEGRGSDAVFGFLVRGDMGNEYLAQVAIGSSAGGRTVTISTTAQESGPQRMLGTYEPSKWYRITLWLPTRGGNQNEMFSMLEIMNSNGQWKSISAPQSLPARPPKQRFWRFELGTSPGKRNYEVFLDEVFWRQVSQAPNKPQQIENNRPQQ